MDSEIVINLYSHSLQLFCAAPKFQSVPLLSNQSVLILLLKNYFLSVVLLKRAAFPQILTVCVTYECPGPLPI